MDKKHYLIYQVTNTVNNKIYIGKHITENVDDDYFGSGKLLKRAQRKYGIEKFVKTILCELQNEDEMNLLEKMVVTEDFCNRDDTYNINVGGKGGWDYVNRSGNNFSGREQFKKSMCDNKEYRSKFSTKLRDATRKRWKDNPDQFKNSCAMNPEYRYSFQGKHHTEESKRKIGNANRIKLQGVNNGSFGKMWIYNEQLRQNKLVKKELVDTFLDEGWKLGRQMSFNKKI